LGFEDGFGDGSRPSSVWTNGLVSRVSPAPRPPIGLRAMVYSGISIPLSSPSLDLWDMFPTVVSSRSYKVILPPLGFERLAMAGKGTWTKLKLDEL
jgi:hypothetical protein